MNIVHIFKIVSVHLKIVNILLNFLALLFYFIKKINNFNKHLLNTSTKRETQNFKKSFRVK